jgi:hypothetical protein
VEFRCLKKLAKGGGGDVFIGEGLSRATLVYGKNIIIKQIGGSFEQTVNFSRPVFNSKIESIEFPARNILDGIFCRQSTCG